MFGDNKKIKYVEDLEFNRNADFINSEGIDIKVQTERPYKDSVRVIIPEDFTFDNINCLIYLSDTLGRTEFIKFSKHGKTIEIIQYQYFGYVDDRHVTPRVQLRHMTFEDSNDEFEKYYRSTGLTLEEFFLAKRHLQFLVGEDIESTYIDLSKVEYFDSKFRYKVYYGKHNDYVRSLVDDISNFSNRNDDYNYILRINDDSMMKMAKTILDSCLSYSRNQKRVVLA